MYTTTTHGETNNVFCNVQKKCSFYKNQRPYGWRRLWFCGVLVTPVVQLLNNVSWYNCQVWYRSCSTFKEHTSTICKFDRINNKTFFMVNPNLLHQVNNQSQQRSIVLFKILDSSFKILQPVCGHGTNFWNDLHKARFTEPSVWWKQMTMTGHALHV